LPPKGFGAGHHVWISTGVIGQGFNIEERRIRQMTSQIFSLHITYGFLARR